MKTLIIGAGIAGSVAALSLSKHHQVIVISHAESNTQYAQGGIVVRGLEDSPEALIADILAAGAGLSTYQAASILAHEGPALVQLPRTNQGRKTPYRPLDRIFPTWRGTPS